MRVEGAGTENRRGTPRREVNDFDETLPGPWEWDLKRLAASVAVAAHGITDEPAYPRTAVQRMVTAYRGRMAQLAAMAPIDVWYERVDIDAVVALAREQGNTAALASVQKVVARARHHTSITALPKLTQMVDGRRRIIEDPPLILHEHLAFDVAIAGFADAHADQTVRDHAALQPAVAEGRVEAVMGR